MMVMKESEKQRNLNDACEAYFLGKITAKECINALENSERGDRRRREIEEKFNKLAAHLARTANY